MSKLLIYGLGVWVLFVVLAIINAGIREGVYKPILGDLRAHQISSFIFISIIFFVTFIFLKVVDVQSSTTEYWYLGFMWLFLTIVFEFIFGHFVMGNSWNKLFADYNILAGRLWGLVLIPTAIAPRLMSKFI